MNHLETYQMEVYVPKSEAQWMAWSSTAEQLLGHSLDGEGMRSMDYAYDIFLNGITPEDYSIMMQKAN